MSRVRFALLVCIAAIVALFHWSPASAVPVGNFPSAVGINAQTNRIYATNTNSNTISVIDGATSAVIATIPLDTSVATSPRAADVDTVTNRVFIGTHGTSLTVIDGASNAILTNRAFGIGTVDVAFNPDTNRVYLVGGNGTQKLMVVDATTYQTISEPTVGNDPHYIALDRANNRIYVSNNGSGFLSVVDGTTHSVTNIPLSTGFFWTGVDANPITHRVYVANEVQNFIEVIDSRTSLSIGTIPLPAGTFPNKLVVNANNNRVYVASSGRASVFIIDGVSGSILEEIAAGASPRRLRLNFSTGRLYVPNADSANISVILESELLSNPSFDRDSDANGLPDSWVNSGTDSSDGLDVDIPDIYEGRYSLRLVGAGGKGRIKQVSQVIPITGPAGTIFNIEAFSKAADAALTGLYDVRLQVNYAGGSKGGGAALATLAFTRGSHGWERRFGTLTAARNFASITVSVRYRGASGTVWFDGLHVWVSP